MKKILFIAPRNPFSGRYSGDVIRAKKIIEFLSRNNYVKVISNNNKDLKIKKSRFSYQGFKEPSLIRKIVYIIISLIKLKPLQLGFFYCPKLEKYVNLNANNFDLIFFQSFRVAQYLNKDLKEKCLLDMGDLMSKNYEQTRKSTFFLNPIKIVYIIEGLLVKKYENFCFTNFNKIFLFSKKEIKSLSKEFHKKVFQISFGISQIKKLYKFRKDNYKIIFIGNIKYTPNRKACYDFANDVLPKIRNKYPEIELHIIGEISKFDKYILKNKTNVKVFGQVNNLDKHLNKSICGLANLRISTGIQTKLLTYMSYGLPSLCSIKVSKNFDLIKGSKISTYKNNEEMTKIILKFKKNKQFSLSSSKKSLSTIKKFKWDNVLPVFDKFIS